MKSVKSKGAWGMKDDVVHDLFDNVFRHAKTREPSRSEKLSNLRDLEEELIDLRKEVFRLRKELGNEDIR